MRMVGACDGGKDSEHESCYTVGSLTYDEEFAICFRHSEDAWFSMDLRACTRGRGAFSREQQIDTHLCTVSAISAPGLGSNWHNLATSNQQ